MSETSDLYYGRAELGNTPGLTLANSTHNGPL